MPRSGFESLSGNNNPQREGVVPRGNNPQGDRSQPSFHPYQAFTRVDAPSGQQHYENYPDSAHSTHSASQFSGPYGEIRTQPPNTDARPPTATSASQFMTNVGNAQIGSDLAWMDGSHMLRLDLTAHARVEQPATEYARVEQPATYEAEERRDDPLLNYWLDNLTNKNVSKLRRSRDEEVRSAARVLDDYIGRKAANQPYEHKRDDALEALEKLAGHAYASSATSRLLGLRQELNDMGNPEEEE